MLMTSDFLYLQGKPNVSGLFKTQMSAFKVYELLPFLPCGEGEHLLLHIRKSGANTLYVARQLARYFDIKESLVSYAGLKDRFAITEQWFGVHLPGKQDYDLSDLAIDGVELLHYARHNKKLRTGALTGNRFEITLMEVSDPAELTLRWQKIVEQGVPNYYGEQRFGIDNGNISKAQALFAGQKVKDKKKRGLYLSAARSWLFNQIISKRIEQGLFSTLVSGDVAMLSGSQSVFKIAEVTDELITRIQQQDIDISAALWGAGELMSTGQPAQLEQLIADGCPSFAQGLPRFGLKQERRRIRLTVSQPKLVVDGNRAMLSFVLPAGSYATTVLRELLDYQDMSERVGHAPHQVGSVDKEQA
jgi:tRNA pseudouridine13 synthase